MTIFRDSERSGWVEKKTKSSMTRWKRRLLVLSGHPFIGYALYYFKAGRDRAWRMMIPLNGNVQCGIVGTERNSFFIQRMDGDEISAAKRNDEGITEKHDRPRFVFRCSDEREAQYWLETIQDSLTKHSEHLKPTAPKVLADTPGNKTLSSSGGVSGAGLTSAPESSPSPDTPAETQSKELAEEN